MTGGLSNYKVTGRYYGQSAGGREVHFNPHRGVSNTLCSAQNPSPGFMRAVTFCPLNTWGMGGRGARGFEMLSYKRSVLLEEVINVFTDRRMINRLLTQFMSS